MVSVLAQAPITKGHRLARWLINHRHLFLTVLECRSPTSGSWHGQVLVMALQIGVVSLLYPHMAECERAFWAPLITNN